MDKKVWCGVTRIAMRMRVCKGMVNVCVCACDGWWAWGVACADGDITNYNSSFGGLLSPWSADVRMWYWRW